MFKSSSTSLILLGILAVIVGVIAIAWPGVTIVALVILFAVYQPTAGGPQTQSLRSPAYSADQYHEGHHRFYRRHIAMWTAQ